jgi:hypothetical protein
MKREDLIVSPTLSPYLSVDLGARSFVSGVDCNRPRKNPLYYNCLLFSCLRHLDIMHHHASITLHNLVKLNLFGIKSFFVLLVWFYETTPPLLSYL